jgi:hypothetical protein
MHTPIKNNENFKTIKIKSIKYNLDKFYEYCLRMAIVIILGCALKLVYSLDHKSIGKNSILTGIPYLRDYNLSLPIILNISLFIWVIVLYTDPTVNSLMDHNIYRYLYKNSGCYVITNFVLLLLFYTIYFQLYIPLWYEHEFRLSGHVLATLFAGSMICNLINFCEAHVKLNIKRTTMEGVIKVCKFLLYHNLYVIIWTVWVYHEAREAVLSFIISLVYTLLINYASLDRLVISIFYDRNEYKPLRNEKDIIFQNRRG